MAYAPHTRRAVIIAAVAGVLLTFVSAAPATAHAALLASDPPDGAVLDQAPDVVTLTFNEPVTLSPTGTGVLDAHGEPVDAPVQTLDDTVQIDVPALAAGSYIVTWQVVSPDSHPISGAFTFSVGVAAESVAPPTLPTSPPTVTIGRQVAQAAVYLGTLAAAGLIVFAGLLARETTPRVRRRLRRATVAAAVLGILGMVATVPLTALWQSGLGPGSLLRVGLAPAVLDGDPARAATLGAAGLLLALAASARGAGSSAAARVVSLLGGTAALLSLMIVGHTRSTGPAALVLAADALHLLTGAVWFGGLIGLGILVSKTTDASPSGAARALSRFSTLAAPLVAVLTVTGTFLGWRIVGSIDALLTTGYGRTLLVKIGLAVFVVALGGWNRLKLRSVAARGHGPLRRTVQVEGALLATVLAVTGVLVSQSPQFAASTSPPPPTASTSTQNMEAELGEGTVTAVLTSEAGVDTLTFTLLDRHGRPLEPLTMPRVDLSLPEQDLGPLASEVHRTGPGAYTCTLDLPFSGQWEIAISVRTSTYENPIATLTADVTS